MGPSSSSPEVDPPSGERGAPGAGAQPKAFDFDAIVVGTGFGGAVTACRLAQAGLKVRILERGRRYALTDLPALPQPNEFMPDSRRWTWGGSQGLWDIRNLEGVTVAQAAAYGGGSLVYANVHLRPPREVFTDAWPKDCQGRPEKLDDYFDLAAHMLDVAPIPEPWRKIGKTKAMAEAFGKAAVEPTDVFPAAGHPVSHRRRGGPSGPDGTTYRRERSVYRRERSAAQEGPSPAQTECLRPIARSLPALWRLRPRLPLRRKEHARSQLPGAGRAA